MAQLKDRLIDGSSAFLATTSVTPVVNPWVGGQNGPLLNLGRYVNNAAHISRPTIARVVEFPRWVDLMPDPKPFRLAIKSMIEVQSKIDGLQKGITAEFNEQEIGPAGHKQFDFTKSTIAQSDVTLALVDKYGLPYQNLLAFWIRYGMGDPEALLPLITTIRDDVSDALPDLWSATVLFFEPDPRMQTVQKAWLMTNFGPRNNGTDESRRDLTSAGTATELSIPFTGLQDTSFGVMEFAQTELDKLTRSGLNPMTRKAFIDKIDATVAATAGGYFERAKDAESQQI